MKNPYLVLNVNQDATSAEIIRGQALAMRDRKFTPHEIAEARAVMAKPATRLAADFTFPIFPPKGNFKEIRPAVKSSGIQIDSINPDKYSSL
ncbi:MAG: hypothetical protein LUD72_00665 [Bacteroidales bacterium]|nr:hypothetical protein [Bacteroidales bacterium]